MEPTGLNKTVEKRVEVAVLEKRLADWEKPFLVARVATATIAVVMILITLVFYGSNVPVQSFRTLTYPVVILAVFGLVVVLTFAWQVATLKERLDTARKG